jgi:hypothetical protein
VQGERDAFYVGNMKRVGRTYKQTFIDTYSKVSFVKVYDRKTLWRRLEVIHAYAALRLPTTRRGLSHCGATVAGRIPSVYGQ